MSYHRFSIPCLVGISLLFACDGKKATAPGSSATATDFCNSFLQAATSLQTRCFGGGEALWRDLYGRILDCGQFAQDVTAGRLSYDAQQGAQCIDQIGKVDCNQMDEPTACQGAVVGTIASGGSCATGLGMTMFSDCTPGNHCHLDITTCGGTCKPYAQAGASCAYSSTNGSLECADGSSCQSNTDICVADVTEGQPCEGPTAGRCADGLYCEGGSTTAAGVCRKEKTSGACIDETECASNYLCGGVEGSKVCRKAKLPGDSCTPGLGECYPLFSWCGSDGKCTDARAKESQPCGTNNGEYIQCEDGLTCVLTSTGSGTCQKRGDKPAGSPCTSSVECAGTVSYCDPTTSKCVSCS
jgi:hypothetical protein